MKITKQVFIEDKLNLILIPMYTIILAVVYGYWLHCKDAWVWAQVVVPTVIVLLGGVCFYLSLRKTAKKLLQEQENAATSEKKE